MNVDYNLAIPSVGRQNECQPKGGDAVWLWSKGRYGLFADKNCVFPYLSALENALVF